MFLHLSSHGCGTGTPIWAQGKPGHDSLNALACGCRPDRSRVGHAQQPVGWCQSAPTPRNHPLSTDHPSPGVVAPSPRDGPPRATPHLKPPASNHSTSRCTRPAMETATRWAGADLWRRHVWPIPVLDWHIDPDRHGPLWRHPTLLHASSLPRRVVPKRPNTTQSSNINRSPIARCCRTITSRAVIL